MLKSTFDNKLMALTLALSSLSAIFGTLPARAAAPQLPELNWELRSDWIDVKTDVTPAAVGDGVHDDTAAIQAALNRLDDSCTSKTKTVYLPSGTYRITKTLSLQKMEGALIVGNGRSTRIVWGGAPGLAMFCSNGVTRSRYIGLIWDGQNKASIGIAHHSHTYYETRVRHQDEAFINFHRAGILIGEDEVVPTAEVMYRNCLFQNCGSGVATLTWNDANNDFDGCEFQDCGTAINCQKGIVYVRDCHFERSVTTDIFLCSQAHSIRRCTSVGSNQFITTGVYGGTCEATVQDCQVDGWTGSKGAMMFGMRGPTTIFDCAFSHPHDALPPIRLVNPDTCQQRAILSNNVASGSASVLSPGPNASVITLPTGSRGPSLNSPSHSFLKSSETVPGTVFDVKTSFGAKGDGKADDTAAITKAIAAAAKHGSNALVYLPPGEYNVMSTLLITGGNYTVGGSGVGTQIHWSGKGAGPVIAVKDPQSVTLEQMQIIAPDTVACIQQTSAGGASSMTYDGIYVGGSWLGPGNTGGSSGAITSHRANRGLECIGLPSGAVVSLPHFDGSMHFNNCSRATILTNVSVDGVLQVDGAQYEKSGFLGVLGHFTSGNPCDVVVRDNQDLIGTDFYTEQTQSHLHVSGDGAYPDQPGHITIQGSRNHTYAAPIVINDYEGRVTYAGALIDGPASHTIAASGTRPIDIVLMDDTFWAEDPTFQFGSGAQATFLQSIVANDATNSLTHSVSNLLPGMNAALVSGLQLDSSSASTDSPTSAAALADAVAALDDFRLLGAADLAFNYP